MSRGPPGLGGSSNRGQGRRGCRTRSLADRRVGPGPSPSRRWTREKMRRGTVGRRDRRLVNSELEYFSIFSVQTLQRVDKCSSHGLSGSASPHPCH